MSCCHAVYQALAAAELVLAKTRSLVIKRRHPPCVPPNLSSFGGCSRASRGRLCRIGRRLALTSLLPAVGAGGCFANTAKHGLQSMDAWCPLRLDLRKKGFLVGAQSEASLWDGCAPARFIPQLRKSKRLSG